MLVETLISVIKCLTQLLLNFTQIYSPSKYMANTEVNMVKYFQNFGKVTFNAKNPKIRFSFLGLFGLKTTICIDFAVVNTYCVSSTNCAIYSQCQFFTLPEPISWKFSRLIKDFMSLFRWLLSFAALFRCTWSKSGFGCSLVILWHWTLPEPISYQNISFSTCCLNVLNRCA